MEQTPAMRILYVVHEKELGGATRSLLDFIDMLPKNYQIYILSNYFHGQAVDEIRKRNIKILYAPYWRWSFGYHSENKVYRVLKKTTYVFLNILNILSAVYIAALVYRFHLDVIHSNTSVITMGALVARILKIKHIWHIREFGKEDLNWNFVFPLKWCARFMDKNTDSFIYISKAIKNKYEKFLSGEKGILLYDYISIKYIYEKSYSINTNLELLIAGRVSKGKGQISACDAIKILVEQGYTNIRLNIAGAGMIKEIEEYISKIKMQKYIKVLGFVENIEDIRKCMDIELVCSKCEAFGRITLEAMLSGNPVIGSNVGGTIELIQDGLNGFLYEEGNVQDLADKIKYFCEHRDMVHVLGRNSFEYSTEYCRKNRFIDSLIQIYQN